MTKQPPSPGLRIALVSLAIAVSQLAASLYLPALPAMSAELRIGPVAATWTLTAFYAGYALCNLVAGPLSNQWGRRHVLAGGLAVYLVGTLMCAVSPSLAPLLVGRLVQAAGASAAPVVGRAMLRDVQGGGGASRAMMWLSLAMAAAPAAGLPLGGLLQQAFGWRGVFWVLAAAGLVMLVAVRLLLDETLAPAARARVHGLGRRYAGLLRDRPYMRNAATLSCLFAGLGVFFAAGPFIFIQMLGFTPVGYGLLNLLTVAGTLAGSLAARGMRSRITASAQVKAGAGVALAGGVAMAGLAAFGIAQAWAVLGPVVMLVFGLGLVLPAATAAALDRYPGQAGLASALLGFMQIGAAACGAATAGATLGMGGILPVSGLFLAVTALAAWAAAGLHAPAAA